ncbi:MAG: hypothetical protein KAH57_09780 [Thermoplasmata archaeon]|nr:hypothetical protein [Thermoplasmata archaeon]
MRIINKILLFQLITIIIPFSIVIMFNYMYKDFMFSRDMHVLYYLIILLLSFGCLIICLLSIIIKNRPLFYIINEIHLQLLVNLWTFKTITVNWVDIEKIVYCKINNGVFIKYTLIINENNRILVIPMVPNNVGIEIINRVSINRRKIIDMKSLNELNLDPVGGEIFSRKINAVLFHKKYF